MSLNEEVKSLMTQIRASQNDYQRARKKLEGFQAQMAESDKIVRELRSREEDLTEAVRSKDAQLGVLRVRFGEVESELLGTRSQIEAIRAESHRYEFLRAFFFFVGKFNPVFHALSNFHVLRNFILNSESA